MESGILYISHSAIDKQKWNLTIEQSKNSLVYANTDFLDAMSPGWDALIYKDYEAVMPLTWRKKMGISYLCQPPFAQQLGIFSREQITETLVNNFLLKAAVQYRLIEVFLNEANQTTLATSPATNFVLGLAEPYETISALYRGDLAKNLKRVQKFNLLYHAGLPVSLAIEQYKLLYGERLHYRPTDYDALKTLAENWSQQGKAFVRSVHMPAPGKSNTGDLLAIGLFLKDQHRIYNIASSTLPNGRMMEANHYLFDQLIRELAGQDLLLDFEGSDLPGIARFYQKFNPKNRPYFFWKSNRLPAVLRWWKR